MATNNAVNNILYGVTDASNAAAGQVGEFISSNITSGSPVTGFVNATAKNITSIDLTAGDWDVTGVVAAVSNTSLTLIRGAASLVSDTLPDNSLTVNSDVSFGFAEGAYSIPTLRVNVSVTTTVYLVLTPVFTGTCSGYGNIQARRRR